MPGLQADSQVRRTAVVLFNLGGPDGPAAVRPFLRNLFRDPAILRLPAPLRHLVAHAIAFARAPITSKMYAAIGGRSPLLAATEAQAGALGEALGNGGTVRVFVCMRYWHPMSGQVAVEVAAFAPDEVLLLPLYPQYSTTTTASSLADWRAAAARVGLAAPTKVLCCYPTDPGFVAAHVTLIRTALDEAASAARPRVLFSAHGLPESVVARGDPYRWQVEQTAAAVAGELALSEEDWVVCYQSKVGPLDWIGPSTEEEIVRAGRDGVAVVVVPIAFVSEHVETLLELDVTYRRLAEREGLARYVRVPALGTEARYITALAALVRRLAAANGLCSAEGSRLCPTRFGRCPYRQA